MAEKYIQIEPIGEGSTAQVFLVKRKTDNKMFIQKIIKGKDAQEAGRAESKILEKIKSKCEPYLMCFEEMFMDRQGLNIIAQYIPDSVDLFAYYVEQNEVHNLYTNFIIARNLFLGLMILHSANVVHRDIKLENILIDLKTLVTHYIDFGFSCVKGDTNCLKDNSGTLHYVAPEILINGEKSFEMVAASDVWSLGVTLYTAFTEREFYGSMGLEKEAQIMNFLRNPRQAFIDRELERLSRRNAESKFVCELIWPALQVDWKKRMTAAQGLDRLYQMSSMLINRRDLSENKKVMEIFRIAMISIGSQKVVKQPKNRPKLRRHKTLNFNRLVVDLKRRKTK